MLVITSWDNQSRRNNISTKIMFSTNNKAENHLGFIANYLIFKKPFSKASKINIFSPNGEHANKFARSNSNPSLFFRQKKEMQNCISFFWRRKRGTSLLRCDGKAEPNEPNQSSFPPRKKDTKRCPLSWRSVCFTH